MPATSACCISAPIRAWATKPFMPWRTCPMWPAADSLFAELALHAERIALRQGQRQLSYRQLLDQVSRRSAYLTQLGAQRIALALDNGIDWLLWDLAALKAGLVCVPLPGFFSPDQQRHVLDRSEEHTSELQSQSNLVFPPLLSKTNYTSP